MRTAAHYMRISVSEALVCHKDTLSNVPIVADLICITGWESLDYPHQPWNPQSTANNRKLVLQLGIPFTIVASILIELLIFADHFSTTETHFYSSTSLSSWEGVLLVHCKVPCFQSITFCWMFLIVLHTLLCQKWLLLIMNHVNSLCCHPKMKMRISYNFCPYDWHPLH